MDVFQKYVITAWDSLYTILPYFDVYVDEVKYSSKNLAIKVLTVDVDTTNVDQFFPANGVMAPPFMWEEWRPVLYCTFLVVFMLVVSVFFITFDFLVHFLTKCPFSICVILPST